MRDEMIHDIEYGQPEFVVQVDSLALWRERYGNEPTVYSWWGGWGPEHYQLVGIADIVSDTRTEYRWGAAAAAYQPKAGYIMAIYRRK